MASFAFATRSTPAAREPGGGRTSGFWVVRWSAPKTGATARQTENQVARQLYAVRARLAIDLPEPADRGH
jgi:hypothetical protein